MIYIFLFLVIILNNIIYFYFRNKYIFIINFIILSLFAGLRYEVGIDYHSYVNIFNRLLNNQPIFKGIEKGYIFYVKLIQKMGGTQQLIFLINSILIQFLIYKFINENSNNKIKSFFIYFLIGPFYLASFNQTNQAVAIAIFAYSIKFIKKRSLIYFLIYISFGGLFFHYSAFLLIPLYWFLNIKFNFKKIILALFITLMSSIFIEKIISLTPYSTYIHWVDEYNFSKTIFIYLFIIIVIFILHKYIDSSNIIFLNMLLFSSMILILMLLNQNITAQPFMRLNNYFFIAVIILIPDLLGKLKTKKMKMLANLIIFGTMIFLYIRTTIINGYGNNLLPYLFNLKLF